MARQGYLILDSDLHMMEPDDLWARYLDAPYRGESAAVFRRPAAQAGESKDDKGNADAIMGMEVQGLAIPAHGNAQGAAASAANCGAKAGHATRISTSPAPAVSTRPRP